MTPVETVACLAVVLTAAGVAGAALSWVMEGTPRWGSRPGAVAAVFGVAAMLIMYAALAWGWVIWAVIR